jgi:transposase InsO family protein
MFDSYEQLRVPVHVTFGNGQHAAAVGKGNVTLVVGSTEVLLQAVLHVPEASVNLIAIKRILQSGAKVEFSKGMCYISKQGKLLLQTQEQQGLYSLQHNRGSATAETAYASSRVSSGVSKQQEPSSSARQTSAATTAAAATAVTAAASANAQLWHERYGHLSYGSLSQVVKMVDGIAVPSSEFDRAGKVLCELCVQAKQHRAPFPASSSQTSRPMQLVHMDVCGPMPVQSLGGSKYFATFLDDYSGFSLVVPVASKADVPAVVKQILTLLETQSSQQLKAVRTDRGGEYINKQLTTYFGSKGVQHQTAIPYTPEQNGAAERLNRTLMERVRALLLGSGLQQELWAEAVVTANYLRNRSPTSGGTKTPWEHFTGKRPDVANLRVFGSRAFVLTPKHMRSKLDAVSEPGVIVGYAADSKGYRIMLDRSSRVVESRDVVFKESSRPHVDSTSVVAGQLHDLGLSDNTEQNEQHGMQQGQSSASAGAAATDAAAAAAAAAVAAAAAAEGEAQQPAHSRAASLENMGAERGIPRARSAVDTTAPESRYPQRVRQPPGQWYVANAATADDEPTTVQQALSRPDADMWRHAMDEEMASLIANETW